MRPIRKPRPVISIVMVAFGGGWSWVPRALAALKENTPEPYEVVLVDNGGTDDRPVPPDAGVQMIRNQHNLGFGPASNEGAERARADVLCLLNTDAIVEPAWLPPLLQRLAGDRVGAVFPAKLNMDGTMQEAGAFVTSDAHAFVFGDGDDPDRPELSFRREVDFGSAACVCLRRESFAAVAGFDPAYRLAYYEDADLCLRLRRLGLRLVYEPRSRVKHARTVSAETAELAKVYASNRDVFLTRWESTIETRPQLAELRADARARLTARDLHARPRVLLIEDGLGDVQAVAARLASNDPSAIVTLVGEHVDAEDERHLLASGVEVVRREPALDWLGERSGHYSHVGRTDGDAWRRLERMIRGTQPSARIVDAVRLEDAVEESA
jgi:O-antigen biosynthesis protein